MERKKPNSLPTARQLTARELVAKARRRSQLSSREATRLAVEETRRNR